MRLAAGEIGGLRLAGAVLWIATYALLIRRNARDRALGMPLPALAANLAIEFTFSVLMRGRTPPHYALVYGIWLALDVVVLVQALRFGRRHYRDTLPGWRFDAALAGALAGAFAIVLAITGLAGDWDGRYSSFLDNVLMSVLFVAMVRRRPDVDGQSMYIAIAKMIGTASFWIMLLATGPFSPLLTGLGVAIVCVDAVYAVQLHERLIALGLNPWTRW